MRKLMKYGVLACVAGALITGGPALARFDDGADVWFLFESEQEAVHWLSLLETDFNATVAVFEGADIAEAPATVAAPEWWWSRDEAELVQLSVKENEVYYIRIAGERLAGKQDAEFDTGSFSLLLKESCDPAVELTAPDATIACESFSGDENVEAIHQLVADAFKAVEATVTDAECDTADVARSEIKVDLPILWVNRRGETQELAEEDILEIAEMMANRMNVVDADGEPYEWDGTVDALREMFHNHFLFQPGTYTIDYTVEVGELSDEATQEIIVEDDCRGCLGCYSCNACRNCRPVPDDYMQLKRLLSDWLLVGLTLLLAVSWTAVRKQ